MAIIVIIGGIIFVCALMLIGVYTYRKRKQHKATLNHHETAATQETSATPPTREERSPTSSMYDEIEMYASAGRGERQGGPSVYTVLNRDPYGYDELYGLQRIAILLDRPTTPTEDQAVQKQMNHDRPWASLPTDLNQLTVIEKSCASNQAEYVDMLPHCLEVEANVEAGIGTKVGLSKSMNDGIGFRKGIID